MARPLKLGLDYFPLDTKLEDDVELLEAEFKLEGFAILIKLWQKIYANGYYINWEKDNELLFSRRINAEINLVNSVINGCFQRNLFHKGLHEKYKILTSKGIQDRYLTAASQSKRKHIQITKEYCLVDEDMQELIHEFIELTPEETKKTPEESTQRKEKKRKENNIMLINEFFERIWKLLPKKKGKGKVSDKQKKYLFNEVGEDSLVKAIKLFNKDMKSKDKQFIPYGSTFLNSGYVDYLEEAKRKEENLVKPTGKIKYITDEDIQEEIDQKHKEKIRKAEEVKKKITYYDG